MNEEKPITTTTNYIQPQPQSQPVFNQNNYTFL